MVINALQPFVSDENHENVPRNLQISSNKSAAKYAKCKTSQQTTTNTGASLILPLWTDGGKESPMTTSHAEKLPNIQKKNHLRNV